MKTAKNALSMSYVSALVNYLLDVGFTQTDILAGSFINPMDLKNKKGFITKAQYIALMTHVITLMPAEKIAAGVIQRSSLTQHGLLGLLALCGFNLQHVLNMMLRFSSLRMNLVHFDLLREKGRARLYLEPVDDLNQVEEFTLMITALAMADAKRQLCHPVGQQDRIAFSFAKPAHFERFVGFDHLTISFDSAKTFYEFPEIELKRPIKSADEPSFDVLSTQCEALLVENSTDCLVEKIKGYLKKVEGDFPNLEQMARAFHLSTRSLSRHLKNKNVNFQTLLNQEKIERAKKLMRHSQLSLTEIAGALSFSDSSYLAKVFKKEVNMTPNEYRRQCVSRNIVEI